MLKKLFKHEFKTISKMGGLLVAVSGCLTLLAAAYLVSPLFSVFLNQSNEMSVGMTVMGVLLGVLGILSYVAMLVGVSFGFTIFLGVRFFRSMYSDEGYLTNTLPVKPMDLLIVKVVTAAVWMLIMNLILYGFMILLILIGTSRSLDMNFFDMLKSIRQLFGTLVDYFFADFRGDLKVSALLILLMVFVGPFAEIAIMFGSLTIGQLSWKNKGLTGIWVYLGMRMAMGMVGGFASIAFNIIAARRIMEGSASLFLANGRYLVSLLISIAFGVALFFISSHIVKNRLNLE
ncbi:MAG: hypothetical protein J6Z33_01755 [Lachnospiraceae bacterium]|nr:hypothetical protein [Lachnospiraceae bacterium]